MPGKKYSQMASDVGGELGFFSSQDRIQDFLGGGDIANYGGVCLALVMMWFKQDTSKKDPCKGVVNKAAAMKLQAGLAATGKGFAALEDIGAAFIGQQFWWKSNEEHKFLADMKGPETCLRADTKGGEGMNIFVIFGPDGGHAIGVWRFKNGVFAVYDPNGGMAAVADDQIGPFLSILLKNWYSDMTTYMVCSFYRKPR